MLFNPLFYRSPELEYNNSTGQCTRVLQGLHWPLHWYSQIHILNSSSFCQALKACSPVMVQAHCDKFHLVYKLICGNANNSGNEAL